MKLSTEMLFHQFHISGKPSPLILSTTYHFSNFRTQLRLTNNLPEKPTIRLARTLVLMPHYWTSRRDSPRKLLSLLTITAAAGVPPPPLDLTEDNVRLVLADARNELGQIFDTSVGITGQAELADLDGPFVKISLKGRFWHKRSTVLARIANYLKQRIPEILEVEIEDEKQLDDSPKNF